MIFDCSIGSEIYEAYPELRDSVYYFDSELVF